MRPEQVSGSAWSGGKRNRSFKNSSEIQKGPCRNQKVTTPSIQTPIMEDDNEILDWGNEDDEHNETLRKPLFDSDRRDTGEPEDTVSLGDSDEDNQEYLSYRGENGHSANARDITESQLRASTPQETLLVTGAKQELQHLAGETIHEKPSTPPKSSSTEDSPRRKRDSRDRSSPQRSQANHGRLTHALPPKPMTAKVPPYLPPSHPSIVEATSMILSPRAGVRETKKNNGVSTAASIPSTADELPLNWEYREARNGGGRYYYNKVTHISTWEKPVSSVPSPPSLAEPRRRRRSSSTGRRHPPDSNLHQAQTTRPSRNSAHLPPDREMDEPLKSAPPRPNVLSYEDRHYRPSGEPSSATVELRTTERFSEVVNNRVSSQSRYDRMPPASPPPARRRARSSSPRDSRVSYLHEREKEHPSRGNSHSARGQNAYTNDLQRDFEPAPGYAEHRSVRSPHHLDFPRSDRDYDSSRRRGRRQTDEPMVDEQRRGSTPPPPRDRDQYYEPIVRDYRVPPEEDPRSSAPSRKDRSIRHDRPAAPPTISPTINLVTAGPDFPYNRPRDRDLVPLSRRREPSKPHSSDLDRLSPDLVGQTSRRKRAPLPPQATTFLTSSTAPAHAREAHSSAAPVAPRNFKLPDLSGSDGNVPLGPRSMAHVNEELSPQNGPTTTPPSPLPPPHRTTRWGPKQHQEDDVKSSGSRWPSSHSTEERMDRYSRPRSKSGSPPAEYTRPVPQPSSGTNSIPIGNRRPLTPTVSPLTTHVSTSSLPPAIGYNPDARPPPSTLIDPVKARELPPGKESYERPADLEIARTPPVGTANDVSLHNNPRPPHHSDMRANPQNRTLEQPHGLPPAPDPSTSLSHRLSYDKPRNRHHSTGPISGRGEKSREAELSFHNAHAELARELEEGMTFQERLERPERPQAQRRGASLLDRLSTGNSRSQESGSQQSLRDRIIPSKRDREDIMDEGSHDFFDSDDVTESKRARRKNGKARIRGGRRTGPA